MTVGQRGMELGGKAHIRKRNRRGAEIEEKIRKRIREEKRQIVW